MYFQFRMIFFPVHTESLVVNGSFFKRAHDGSCNFSVARPVGSHGEHSLQLLVLALPVLSGLFPEIIVSGSCLLRNGQIREVATHLLILDAQAARMILRKVG